MALGSMRQLETLDITVERLTADLPAALNELTQLQNLSISCRRPGRDAADDNDARLIDECLAAIGNMTHLELLRLLNLPLHGKGLACLTGLKGLKTLHVEFWRGDWNGSELEEPVADDSLRAISALTQLEWLKLENLYVRNESLTCLAGLTNLKTLSLSGLYTADRPMLTHLPSLPCLETLTLPASRVEDDDLRRLAVLPKLKSLSLLETGSFTPTALEALGLLDSLEELHFGDYLVPDQVEALVAVKRLKRLHVGGRVLSASDVHDLMCDDATNADASYLGRVRRAFRALRQSNPGLIVDKEQFPVFRKCEDTFSRSNLNVDALPERPATWLPGGDLTWMTPQELAAFEQSGGRASFYGATYPGGPGQEPITAEF